MPVAGGKETRLTTAKGLDDGPEYSPDGSKIYFNSERSGRMQIWSMAADGSGQAQAIDEVGNDWFPHISPDGKWMVYLAYKPEVTGHPGAKMSSHAAATCKPAYDGRDAYPKSRQDWLQSRHLLARWPGLYRETQQRSA